MSIWSKRFFPKLSNKVRLKIMIDPLWQFQPLPFASHAIETWEYWVKLQVSSQPLGFSYIPSVRRKNIDGYWGAGFFPAHSGFLAVQHQQLAVLYGW